MSDVEDDGFVTVHHGPRPNGRWCRICLRYEVKPNGWCAKCGNHVQKPEAGDASPDQVTEILREACNIISDEAEAIRAGVQIIGTSNMSVDPQDAHAVDRVKELEGWIARAGVIIDQHRDEIASWKMAASEAELECKALRDRLTKEAKAHEKEIAVLSENYAALERKLNVIGETLRGAEKAILALTKLTNPSEARADE